MENENILDPENPFHILALHITFLPRINQALKLFRWAWNCHPISTEGNKTPEQLMLLHLPPGNTDMIMSQVTIFSIVNISKNRSGFRNLTF